VCAHRHILRLRFLNPLRTYRADTERGRSIYFTEVPVVNRMGSSDDGHNSDLHARTKSGTPSVVLGGLFSFDQLLKVPGSRSSR